MYSLLKNENLMFILGSLQKVFVSDIWHVALILAFNLYILDFLLTKFCLKCLLIFILNK